MLQLQSSAWDQSTERTNVANNAKAAEMQRLQQQLGDALRSKGASLSQEFADDPGPLSPNPVWFATADERAASPFAFSPIAPASSAGMRLRPEGGLGCGPDCVGCMVRRANPNEFLGKGHAARAEQVCACVCVGGCWRGVMVVRIMSRVGCDLQCCPACPSLCLR